MKRLARSMVMVSSFALVMGSLSAASAQAPAGHRRPLRESLTGEARASYNRAMILVDAKNPAGAAAELERAYDLSKDPRLLYNLALVERDQKRYVRGIVHLKRALTEGSRVFTAGELAQVRDAIDAFGQFTASLSVDCREPGAAVLVDDEGVGQTPFPGPVPIDVGEHRVTARKAGFRDATTTVLVAAGALATAKLTLDPIEPTGVLVVDASRAPDARVVVDGVEVGAVPWRGEVPARKHTVVVRAKGYVEESRTEDVVAGATSTLSFAMRLAQGHLRIKSNDHDNEISIDGRHVGRGTWSGVVAAGTHSLRLTRDGAEPYTGEVVIQPDDERELDLDVRSKPLAWYWWAAGGALLAGGAVTGVVIATHKNESTVGSPGSLSSPNRVPVSLSVRY